MPQAIPGAEENANALPLIQPLEADGDPKPQCGDFYDIKRGRRRGSHFVESPKKTYRNDSMR
jgi:hypothetical protein